MLRETVSFGRIGGIRVGAHWSALVTLGLFILSLGQSLADAYGGSVTIWLMAAVGALGLLASLLLHELAHSLVARRADVQVDGVVLWLLGGVSELGDEPKDARSDLRIALAGPLTSLLLAAGFFAVAAVVGTAAGDPALRTLVWLASMNLLLAVFNMLPGAPLDGGRVLRALVWRSTGDRLRAATVAARSGRTLGLFLILLGVAELIVVGNPGGIWLMLLGWFLYSAANVELTTAGLRQQLGDTRIRDVMTAHPVAIPVSWSVAELLRSPAMHSDHRVFPVVDAAGQPVAVLSWADLTALPVHERERASVRSVARPLAAAAKAAEDQSLSDVASRVILRPHLDIIAVVDPSGRLTGVVTATDLALACHRSALGLPLRGTDGKRSAIGDL
ncbi:site-2 protease family protein [Nocardia sp. NPDC005366]|uniref:site-2 protease family protein n=1 Tax=Nocardia sp. NPDC005366 TaxID=3156878 RepID=UPI00339F49DF